MCKKYEECCSEEFNCDCGEDENIEMTKEDLIQLVAEDIQNGECLGCSLTMLFDLAYDMGKKDLALESMEFYQDVLEEDITD